MKYSKYQVLKMARRGECFASFSGKGVEKTQSPAWRAMTFMIIMRAPGCSEVPPDKFSKVSLIG